MMRETNAGFLAIFSLIFATISSTFLRNNYSHFEEAFSDLGELNSPYYIFFNIFAFVIPGLLMLYSISGLNSQLGISDSDVLSLKIGTLGWIIAGIFPISYSISWLYWAHIIGALIAFIFGPLGIIQLSLKLSSDAKWAYFSFTSTIIAFVSWASLLFFDLYLHKAITQLITIGLLFFWYFLFLLKLSRTLEPKLCTYAQPS